MKPFRLFSFALYLLVSVCAFNAAAQNADVDSATVQRKYAAVANRIINAALADSVAYKRLVYLCDTFGPRFSGSPNLERAIDWIMKTMREDRLDSVRKDTVSVPHWMRGNEWAEIVSPYRRRLPVLGAGGTCSTPTGGITGEVMVVNNFDELTRRCVEAKGKIVLFNMPFENYGQAVQYRGRGAIEAARCGAIGSLYRSVTPFSLQTPHTGMMRYVDTVPKIPHAAVTVEDGALLERLSRAGVPVRVRMYTEGRFLPDALSHNLIAELRGSEKPEEIVLIGGHIDSWDVGQGAQDDGGQCVAVWQALLLLKKLGLRPKRTIRAVLWTNEENGVRGARAYYERYKSELGKHLLAIETDAGTYPPRGLGVGASDSIINRLRAIAPLLNSIGANEITKGGGGADIGILMQNGVPGAGFHVKNDDYFWYHHTDADTVDKVKPEDLNACIAALAVYAYVYADWDGVPVLSNSGESTH